MKNPNITGKISESGSDSLLSKNMTDARVVVAITLVTKKKMKTMKIIEPYVQLINAPDYDTVLNTIETAGRVCYKSEDKITDDSAEKFIDGIIKRGHEAVLEHAVITARFVCDRGVSHEIVRHRMASYCQESTRYCNYSKDKFGREITFIKPSFFDLDNPNYNEWEIACSVAEYEYLKMLDNGATPQEARTVLPNSLKTEVIMTANIREWRHFMRLRCSEKAHPQMREVAMELLVELVVKYPIFFKDIYDEMTK